MTRFLLPLATLFTVLLWQPATSSPLADDHKCVTYREAMCVRVSAPDGKGRVQIQLWQPGWRSDKRKFSWWCETTSPFNPRVGMRCIKSRWQ